MLQLGLKNLEGTFEFLAGRVGGLELRGAAPDVGFQFLTFRLPGTFLGGAIGCRAFRFPSRHVEIVFESGDRAGQLLDA